jgi:hypothetical protein
VIGKIDHERKSTAILPLPIVWFKISAAEGDVRGGSHFR